MILKPLSDRVLIKPEKNPELTASGLHLPEHRKPETAGTVVSVGLSAHPLREEAEALAVKLDASTGTLTTADDHLLTDAAGMLRDLTCRVPSVRAGDFVIFSWQSGQELWIDEERYLIMREQDISAVVEDVKTYA